jgi:transposase
MRNCIAVGCDLHEKNMLLMTAHNDGRPQKRSFGTDRESRQKMIAYLKQCQREAGADEVVFVYEASNQGYVLHDALRAAGIECHVLAPTNMEQSPKRRKHKTDEKDAQAALDALRSYLFGGKALPVIWVPDPQTREDRELVRARQDLGQKITGVETQIRSLLKRQDVAKPKGLGQGWTARFRAWLRGLTQPGSALGTQSRPVLASLLRQLGALEAEREALDVAVIELAQTERYRDAVRELRQEKGVGVLTAMIFLTEMGNLLRFANRRQVGNYVGLTPSSYESGEADDRKGHITHQGSWWLRRALCQAYWARLRTDLKEKARFEAWLARHGKKKMVGVVAGMRRLTVRLWHIGRAVQERMGVLAPPPVPPKGGSASLRPRHAPGIETLAGALPC